MDLVQDATVRIHRPPSGYAQDGPEGDFLGSGFFVAPSWVLTCAHVAMRGEGGMVAVWFKGDRYSADLTEVPGRVVAALPGTRPPGPGGWPAPDLALIQLQRPVEHPCVYVTERSEAMLRSREVRCVGWAPVQGGGLQNRSGVCVVKGSYGGSGDAEQVVRIDGDWVELGMSGGPLVDLARGEVVGVIKSQINGHQGGTAVGVERLRTLEVPAGPVETETDDIYQSVFHAHDRYHADRHTSSAGTERTWTDAQSDLPDPPGGILGPKLRAELLGRLAELPPPASTRSLLTLLDRLPGVYARDHRPAPRGWRDGLGALYDARARDREARFELIVRYCMGVLAADRPCGQLSVRNAKALWGWVKRIADTELPRDLRRRLDVEWAEIRLRLEQSRQRAARAPAGDPVLYGERDCVVLHVDLQGWARDQYDWRVAVDRRAGEAEPVDEDSRGAALGTVPDRLAAALTEAFRRCDEPGSPAMLQVVVAPALFGLPVDDWVLPPSGLRLGAVRPVVLRSPYQGPADERPARWDAGLSAAIRAEVVDCEDELRVRVPESARLRGLAHGTVPVLCRYGNPDPDVTAGVVRLLDSGFGVALLQRRTAEGDTVCKEFHRRVAEAVSDTRTHDRLPWKIHELRRGVSAGRTEMYWSAGAALYYDDPHRPLPGSDFLEAP
ncbi:trypsin-like peptidase domain-containing protein [Streptomyces sp. SID9727]|uniref:VMAP-C domain-containing protein n=1 Tax=Streptomyces sp. SID9727 TaxID=2706114 RepID=UPI0013C951CF|nr:trypsin-like peptidase domain-containing protein [Streptomyces sp. SID9727]NEC63782.1 trypsin-like peptidase domain-containing protein [Streptomyces sp. SID9727]